MVTSSSPLSFTDCFEVFDRALASTSGVRLRFPSEGDARHFRTRLHSARTLHRRGNAEIYDFGHPMHGNSEYDKLIIKLRIDEIDEPDGQWLLLIEKVERALAIEDIVSNQDSP